MGWKTRNLNPISYLLALFGPHHILHVSKVRVKNVLSYLVLYIFRVVVSYTRVLFPATEQT